MVNARPTKGPQIAADASWRTRQPERTVLGVVHNVTSATRLFDVLPLLAADPRVEVLFACTASSPFTSGVDEDLELRGVRQVDWADLADHHIDLAISTSHGGPLHELRCPIVILPHGMGYNKYLSPKTENRKPKTENRKPKTENRYSVWHLSGCCPRVDRLLRRWCSPTRSSSID